MNPTGKPRLLGSFFSNLSASSVDYEMPLKKYDGTNQLKQREIAELDRRAQAAERGKKSPKDWEQALTILGTGLMEERKHPGTSAFVPDENSLNHTII